MLSDPASPGTPGSDAAADAPAVSAPPQLPGGQPRPLQRQESPGQVGRSTTIAVFTMLRSCCRSEALIETFHYTDRGCCAKGLTFKLHMLLQSRRRTQSAHGA